MAAFGLNIFSASILHVSCLMNDKDEQNDNYRHLKCTSVQTERS